MQQVRSISLWRQHCQRGDAPAVLPRLAVLCMVAMPFITSLLHHCSAVFVSRPYHVILPSPFLLTALNPITRVSSLSQGVLMYFIPPRHPALVCTALSYMLQRPPDVYQLAYPAALSCTLPILLVHCACWTLYSASEPGAGISYCCCKYGLCTDFLPTAWPRVLCLYVCLPCSQPAPRLVSLLEFCRPFGHLCYALLLGKPHAPLHVAFSVSQVLHFDALHSSTRI